MRLLNRNYCEFWIDSTVVLCTHTRGRRISGFCGGLGGDQETGGKLRAAGRVRIVGKNLFSFVRECVGVVYVYRRWYFIFAVAKLKMFSFSSYFS